MFVDTRRTCFSTCRAGSGCSPRSRISPCHAGRGCSPRSGVSACHAGRGCSPCSCFSAFHAGSPCSPRSSSSAYGAGTGCSPRRSTSACGAGTGCSPHRDFAPSRGGMGYTPRSCPSCRADTAFSSSPCSELDAPRAPRCVVAFAETSYFLRHFQRFRDASFIIFLCPYGNENALATARFSAATSPPRGSARTTTRSRTARCATRR